MEQPRPVASRAPLGSRSVNTVSSQDAAAGRSSSASSSLLMAKINAMRARENVKTHLAAQSDYPTPPPSSQSPPHSQASRYSASPSSSASPLTPATKKASSSAYKRDRPLLSPAAPAVAILSTSNGDSPNPRMKKRADERPTPNRRPISAQPRYESDADDDDDEDDAEGPSNSPRRSKTASSSNSRRVLDLMSIRSDPVQSEAAANNSQSMDNSNSSSSMRRSGRKRTQAPGKGIAAALAPAPPRDTSMRSSASTGRRSATPRQPTPTTSTRQSVQPVVRAPASAPPAAPAAVESDPETSDPNELFESSDEEFDAHQPVLAKPQARRGRVSTSQPLPSSSKSRNTTASRRSAPPARRRATSGQLTKTPANSRDGTTGKRRAATTMERPPPIGPRDKLSPFVPRPASPSDDPLLLKPREWERRLRGGRDDEGEEENHEDGEVNDTFAAAGAGRNRRRVEEMEEKQQQQRAATRSTSANEPRASLLDPDLSEHEYSCGQVDGDQDEAEEVSDNEREGEAAGEPEAAARSFSSDFSRLAAEMRADLGKSVAEEEQEEQEEAPEQQHDAFNADLYGGGDGADFAGHDDRYGYLDAAAGVSDDDSDEDVRASHNLDDEQAAGKKEDEHMPEQAEAPRNEADMSAEGADESMAEGVIADGTWPEEEEQSGATEAAATHQEELQEDSPAAVSPVTPRHIDNISIRDEEGQSLSEDEAADSLELSQEPPSEEQEPVLAVSERQLSVDVDERDAAEAEQTLNGFANMSVTQDEEEDEDEDEVLAEDPFLNAAARPIESTPARNTTTASTSARPNLFSQSVILPSPSTTTAGITMAQRSHSHLESDSMRSMMHSLPRATPIVEVMSSDPQAAARAAAILRMHHNWIHEGSLTTTTGADGGETFVGNVLAGLDESATRGEDELPQMLKDAEAELAKMGLKEGSSQAQIAASSAPVSTASPAPAVAAAAATPLANQTLSAPTPKIPGAWSWSPLSFLAPAPSASSSRASTRPPTPVNDSDAASDSPLLQALQADPTNFPRAAWKALEKTVRSMVREEVKSGGDAERDEKIRRRQAYLHLSRAAVVDRFLLDNAIDPAALRDRWSRRSLERSVVALQRQFFARLEREHALTEEETAFLAAEGASSRVGSISIFSAAPSDLTTMSSLQTPMSSISRVAAVASVAQPAAASPSPLMLAALASHSTPVARATPTAGAPNKAAAPTPLPPPSPIATPAQPSPSPAAGEERVEEDVAATPVQQRTLVEAVPATPVQQQGSAEAAPGSVSRWSLKKRISQMFSRGEVEVGKEQAQEQETAPAPQQSTESIAPATPSPTAVVPDVEQVNTSRPSTPSIYPALPSPSTFNAPPPPPPPEPTASDLSIASARQHRAPTASSSGDVAPRRSRSSTAADESCGSDSSLLAQEAAAAAAVMAQKRQLNRASRTTGLVTENATSPGGGKGGNRSMSAWVSPRALRQARASQGAGQQRSPLRREGSSKATVSAAVDKYTSRASSTSTTSSSPSHARARSSLSLSHRSTSFIRPTITSSTNFSPPRRHPAPTALASRSLGFTGSSRSAGSSFVRPTVLAGLGDDSHASARLKAQALSKAREQQTWLSPLAKRRRAEREAMKRGTGGRGTDQIAQAVAEEARRRKSGVAGMSAGSSFLLARKQREADETAALSVEGEGVGDKENSFDGSAASLRS